MMSPVSPEVLAARGEAPPRPSDRALYVTLDGKLCAVIPHGTVAVALRPGIHADEVPNAGIAGDVFPLGRLDEWRENGLCRSYFRSEVDAEWEAFGLRRAA